MTHVFKCKICGGALDISAGETICTCDYCGTTQTLPLLDSDKKIRLFNRANEYRLENEFDKAYSAYEAIVLEEPDEAEAYWGLVLSDYGVEYVEDPKTHKRIPTCHRTKTQSVLNSTNYKQALEHADAERRMMYQDEAEAIDKLQKQILSVSSREEPYDVFICYKETDDEGNRTQDSVIAQEIYNQLEREGIRAFLARVSLKDHIGENYEPYIYAALNSAKVMLLVTTKAEYCDAVWVKNEWSRFLKLREEDISKTIVPVYRDMSPYELPAELQALQSQDIGKVGSMQDLVAGVKRIIGRKEQSENDALLNQLLEKQRHEVETKQRQERAQIEAERRQREQSEQIKGFFAKNKIKIALASILIIAVLVGTTVYRNVIAPRNALKSAYNAAVEAYENEDYSTAADRFKQLDEFNDSKTMMVLSRYRYAQELIESGQIDEGVKIIKDQAPYFRVSGIDQDKLLEARYDAAVTELNYGLYNNALEEFTALGSYRDSEAKITETQYQQAVYLMNNGEPAKAIKMLEQLAGYADSNEQLTEAKYQYVISNIDTITSEMDPYIEELTNLGYKEIDQYRALYNQRKAILGVWKSSVGGSIVKVSATGFKRYADQEAYEHNDGHKAIEYTYDRMNNVYYLDDDFFGVVYSIKVNGNSMIISIYDAESYKPVDWYSGTYYRIGD